MLKSPILEAALSVRDGGVIAYPTEAVYGLGCDPLNENSVLRLLKLKQRDSAKGLILIAADFQQLEPFVKPISDQQMATVSATWPGPVTWLFPAADDTPGWLTGNHSTLAVRVTAHPVAAELCKAFGGPLVSTSANISSREPARSAVEVRGQFDDKLAAIVTGQIDQSRQPTPIFDAISGEQVRK